MHRQESLYHWSLPPPPTKCMGTSKLRNKKLLNKNYTHTHARAHEQRENTQKAKKNAFCNQMIQNKMHVFGGSPFFFFFTATNSTGTMKMKEMKE